jgi:hypothetical protein
VPAPGEEAQTLPLPPEPFAAAVIDPSAATVILALVYEPAETAVEAILACGNNPVTSALARLTAELVAV